MGRPAASGSTTRASSARRDVASVGAYYVAQGLMLITLTTNLPVLRTVTGASQEQISLLMFVVIMLAGLGAYIAEALIRVTTSRVILRVALTVSLLAMVTMGLSEKNLHLLIGASLVYGVSLGAADAGMNMQAIVLQHEQRRPVMLRLHAMWAAGGALATVLNVLMKDAAPGHGLFPAAALAALALLSPVREMRHPQRYRKVDVPWRRLIPFGVVIVLFYVVDNAATVWGPIYLKDVLDAPHGWHALATMPYLLSMLITRYISRRLVVRWGAVFNMGLTVVVGAGALLVIILAPNWVVAIVGFAFLGGAVAVIAPMTFSAAGALAYWDTEDVQYRLEEIVARFNQFNYVGAILGASFTGLVGDGNLRVGYVLPLVAILLVMPFGRRFSIVDAYLRERRG